MNYKKLFIALCTIATIAYLLLFASLIKAHFTTGESIVANSILLIAIAVIAIFAFYFIGKFVYYDALKHRMNPWLWVTVSIFLPSLLGLVAYFISRTSYPIKKR